MRFRVGRRRRTGDSSKARVPSLSNADEIQPPWGLWVATYVVPQHFAWTELGAERIGVIQSLLATCRLHAVDPYTYLVDILQRVGEHPSARAVELTPRVWKTLFADDPLRSDLVRARDPPTR